MKAKELEGRNKEELTELLKEKKAELIQARFEVSSRQLKNYRLIRNLKKDIARINTTLNQVKEVKKEELKEGDK